MTIITQEQPLLSNLLQSFDTEQMNQAAKMLEERGFDVHAVAKLVPHSDEAKLIAAFAEYLIQTNDIALPNWSFLQWSVEYDQTHLTLFGLTTLAQDLAETYRFALKITSEIKGVVTDLEDAEVSLNTHHFSSIVLETSDHHCEVSELSCMVDYNAFLKAITPTGVSCLKRELSEVLKTNKDLSGAIWGGHTYSE